MAVMPSVWSTYFAVDDTASAMETAEANGGHVTYGPLDIPDVGCWQAWPTRTGTASR